MSWVGFDLDGTLAVYDGWKGIDHIGQPIPAMVKYAKSLLDAGIEVRIFTARLQEGITALAFINSWTKEVFGQILPVTDRKDFDMVFLVDDRAVAVEKNTGKFLTPPPAIESIAWHSNSNNPENPAYVESD